MVNVPPYDKQSKPFMKNSKKFYKHPSKSVGGGTRHYFHSSELGNDSSTTTTIHTSGGGGGENSSISAPAIAIVAPTARNPSNHSHTHGIHSSIASSCKAHAAISPQMTVAATSAPPPPRTMHVQHHIHHIQPVQISTTLSPPPATSATPAGVQIAAPPQVANWPVVEPAFHFGPGFEIHQTYCPTHSHNDQHLVLFHIMPGVAVSFTIAGGHKIIQGEYQHIHICINLCKTGFYLNNFKMCIIDYFFSLYDDEKNPTTTIKIMLLLLMKRSLTTCLSIAMRKIFFYINILI